MRGGHPAMMSPCGRLSQAGFSRPGVIGDALPRLRGQTAMARLARSGCLTTGPHRCHFGVMRRRRDRMASTAAHRSPRTFMREIFGKFRSET
jgi:hypothetical protein